MADICKNRYLKFYGELPLFFLFLAVKFSVTLSASVSKLDSPKPLVNPYYTFVVQNNQLKNCEQVNTDLCKKLKEKKRNLDKSSVIKLLDSLGYLSYTIDSSDTKLTFKVGPQSHIANIEIQSPDTLLKNKLELPSLPISFNKKKVLDLVHGLNRTLGNKGYPFSTSALTLQRGMVAEDTHSLLPKVFTLNIFSDSLYRIAGTKIKGFKVKSDKLLRHDIRYGIGDTFNLSLIEETEKRLQTRSYISFAKVESPLIINSLSLDFPDSLRSERSSKFVFIPMIIQQNSGLGFDGALGYDSRTNGTGALQGSLNFYLLNTFNKGERGAAQYEGDRSFQKAALQLTIPWIGSLPIVGFLGLGLEIQDKNYSYFQSEIALGTEVYSSWTFGGSLKTKETIFDSLQLQNRFVGFDLILAYYSQRNERGRLTREFTLNTGSGLARGEEIFTRSHVDLLTGVHLPFLNDFALKLSGVANGIISTEPTIPFTELYRVGGFNSIRGYREKEVPCRAIGYLQLENLYYFSNRGAGYIFTDVGMGYQKDTTTVSDIKKFWGFGIGTRLPTGSGILSLEWAWNYNEFPDLGRIHIRFQNDIALTAGRLDLRP